MCNKYVGLFRFQSVNTPAVVFIPNLLYTPRDNIVICCIRKMTFPPLFGILIHHSLSHNMIGPFVVTTDIMSKIERQNIAF